jgi:3-deoxy-D-manno-octulosonic-acid transferase
MLTVLSFGLREQLMRLIYSAIFILLLPAILLRMLLRSRKAPAYRRRLRERLGIFSPPSDTRPLLWVHAVSLGETVAASPLIERMLSELPAYRIAVTTTTPTGSAQLRQRFGDRVFHVYAPWDTPGSVKRCLQRLKPQLLVIMETELWPNLLHYCARSGCRLVLANGRLSERSAKGYGRLGPFTRNMLGQLDLIAAQNDEAARRFAALGAPAERLLVTGSVKFDLSLDEGLRERAAELAGRWQLDERPVVVAASTHEGEETLVLEAFTQLRKQLPASLLILVPRHPERFDRVDVICRDGGWNVLRRSNDMDVGKQTDVLLLDSIGELLVFFGLADVAVIGGSFFDRGGHNPLEPAAWAVPVLTGPSMFNFEEITRQLLDVAALEQVSSADALGQRLFALLKNDGERQRLGDAGRAVVEGNRGALDQLFSAVKELLATTGG